MNKKIRCYHCKAQNYLKKGFRKTQNRGKIQKYYCKECNKYFTNDEGFYRMRHNSNKITKAIDLYFSNLSSRKVRNNFKRHEKTKVSHISVLDWCRKYTLKVHNYVDSLNPKLSGRYYADETMIKRRKINDTFWVCIDWETRYINAIHYNAGHQTSKHAIEFMKKVAKNGRPKYLQTDALPFYPRAFRRTFYTRYKKDKVQHRVNNVSKTKKHNVRIETVFMKIKDRVDDFRGLKALWSAPILMTGIVLQHNFIEEHTTTGAIPCDLAQTEICCKENRWLSLIRESVEAY